MEELKQSDDGKIISSINETHDEKSLVEKYRHNYMGFRVAEAKIKQLPAVLAQMEMHIQITEANLDRTNQRLEMVEEALADLNLDIPEEIKRLKEKYSQEDLIEHAKKLQSIQKTSITKELGFYILKTETKQDKEGMLIDLMSLSNSKIEIIETLIKQKKSYEKQKESSIDFEKQMKDIQEKLKTIKLFFASQHKNIDKLLDKYANQRHGGKTAEELK